MKCWYVGMLWKLISLDLQYKSYSFRIVEILLATLKWTLITTEMIERESCFGTAGMQISEESEYFLRAQQIRAPQLSVPKWMQVVQVSRIATSAGVGQNNGVGQ